MSKSQSTAAKQDNPAVSQLEDWCEFIPYHSHYNPHTIISKNGELLQFIKIDGNVLGSQCENLDGLHASIRNTIRYVLSKSKYDDKFAFWLHTIRKRVPMEYLPPPAHSENPSFSEYIEEQWDAEHRVEHYYKNEIFITILYEGETIPLFDAKRIKTLAFPKSNRQSCRKYLDKSYHILEDFTLAMLGALSSQCNANRLSLVERATSTTGKVARPNIFYSEPMEFLGNLLNLRYEPQPLPDMDLSAALQTNKLAFGFNAIESKNKKTGEQNFAAIFSLKQYLDMYAEAVDCVMQAPIEFIISQSLNFVPADNALKNYKDQKNLFGMSGEVKLNKSFGITKMLGYDHKNPIDYCESQTTIMILADEISKLDEETEKFLKEFHKLGLLVVREDIMIEEGFWAQLPGNFEFIRRSSVLATEQVAGFCRLNCFHNGKSGGNHWGNYLALIPTGVNSPYFFNFHVEDNGHTVIFDFNSFSDNTGSMLEYLLLTKTRKFNTKIVIFDRNQSARLLLNKMNGYYSTVVQLDKGNKNYAADKTPQLALNPFALEESNYNKSFLTAWCGLLVAPDSPLSPEDKKALNDCVARLYELPKSERNLPNMVKLVSESAPHLAGPLKRWIDKGECAGLFDHADETLNTDLDVIGFDMTPAVNNRVFALPLFAYLMHKVINSVGEQPTVIVINEAWDLLENAFFAPRLESLLEMLKQKNVMVIFTTSKPQECNGTVTLSAIMAGTATKIYIPDDMPVNYKSEDIDLNTHDDVTLSDMSRQKGDFLLKQNGESIYLRALITEAEDIVAILSNDIKALSSARGKFSGMPKDY